MTRILAIDTASERFAIAVGHAGVTEASIEREAKRDHSKLLLATIEELVGDLSTLDGIAVVRGPGSYTGLRVGTATAQGLGLSLGIPVVGMPALQLVAVATTWREVTAMHPAGRGEFAVQAYHRGYPMGGLAVAAGEKLSGPHLAGEGAGERGGLEVAPIRRAEAALVIYNPPAAGASPPDADPIYLREPHVTRPKKPFGPGNA